jgi:Outer membrane protein beta-barrel domain
MPCNAHLRSRAEQLELSAERGSGSDAKVRKGEARKRMALRKLAITSALAVVVFAGAPARASADWLFTPYLGVNWGGTAGFSQSGADFEDKYERQMNFGASLSWMGAGAVGFEVDFGYSPNFFQNTVGEGDFEFGDSNLTTLMANLKVGAPFGGQHGGGVRPYASGGVGLIKSRIGDAGDLFHVNSTDWGFNAGAGITGFFSDNIGVQGDVRYFRSLQDNEPDNDVDVALGSFRFWRGTVGLVFRF